MNFTLKMATKILMTARPPLPDGEHKSNRRRFRPAECAFLVTVCLWSITLAIGLLAGAAPCLSSDGGAPRRSTYFVRAAAPGMAPVRLSVEEQGVGEPVILLHGLSSSKHEWREISKPLAITNRVFSIDLKGFGRSEKPLDDRYSPFDQAALVRSFIRRQGLRGVTLVGQSLGGLIALLVTMDLNRSDTAIIKRLVLMDSPVLPQRLPFALEFIATPIVGELAVSLLPPEAQARISFDGVYKNPALPTQASIDEAARPLSEPGGRHALVQTARQIVPLNLARLVGRFRTVRQPVQLIWCRDDEIVPLSTALRVRRLLPDARLRVLTSCRHSAPEEAPVVVVGLLRSFMSRGL
jgi:pimeloyl-ACP methyl ester carboxylesterase